MSTSSFRVRINSDLAEFRRPGTNRREILKRICDMGHIACDEYEREQLKIIKALAARMYVGTGFSFDEDLNHYRRLFIEYKPADPSKVPQAAVPSAAALLYERGEYSGAATLLASQPFDARLKFLLAYCYERLGRASGDVNIIGNGLNVVEEIRHRNPSSDEGRLSAEEFHCTGHLLLARATIETRNSTADRQSAIQNLRRASDSFPGYLSCYTSAFAEVGDYGLAIDRSRAILRRPKESFKHLKPHEIATVMAEVKFYLAYALSCTNDYSEAEQLFIDFAESMRDLGRSDAEDHAQLFLIKTRLKRLRLSESNAAQISGLRDKLDNLRFSRWVRSDVGKEKKHYQLVLDFLSELGKLLSKADDSHLEETARRGLEVISDLSDPVRNVLQFPLLSVLNGDDDLCVEFSKALRRTSIRQEFVQNITLQELQLTGKPEVTGDFVILLTKHLSDVEVTRILSYLAFDRFVLAFVKEPSKLSTNWPYLRYAETTNPTVVYHHTIIGLALALIKRFLVEDEYVFALAPCEDSPALEYQRPDRYLQLPEVLQ